MLIIRNKDRYGSIGSDRYPDSFTVEGLTVEQAENLARDMTNYYPGCDYLFNVGVPGEA